jgi:hypothetical protein
VGLSFSRRALMRGAVQMTAAAAVPTLVHPTMTLAVASSSVRMAGDDQTLLAPTFYVSASGIDSADGLTPQTAWATIQRTTASLPTGRSAVLFRRGDTFYGQLNLPFGCEVGAYGEGAKPILTLFKLLNRSAGWTEHSAGVWRIDLGSPDTHDGFTATTDATIGFLTVDGTVMPDLKFALSELSAPWDFFCDVPNHTLYVKAAANPTTLAAEIKAAPKGDAYGGTVIYCQNGGNDVHDVHVTGSGGCGIRGSGSDVRIHNCLIDYIGGSSLAGFAVPNTRYGNGIEHWPNVQRWTIENNEIAQVYDVAWSTQGRDVTGGEVFWADMTIRNNHIHDCGQMVEIWSENSNVESPGFVRIIFEGNHCERAGYGVFADVRPNQQVRVHLLTYNLETPVDITIQNNIFDDAYAAYSYHLYEPPAGYVTRNNTIRLKAGTKMEYQRAETVEQAAVWQAATGREAGSTITVLP